MSTAAKKRLINVPRLSAWGGISLLASLPVLCGGANTFADVIYTDSDIPTANIVSGADGVGNITFDITSEGSYNNVISGSGSVTKTGEGSLTIIAGDGGQTYTGGTTVSAGTLYLYGNNKGKSSVGTGDLIINSGAKVEAKKHNVLGSGLTDVIINGGTLQPYQYLHMTNLEINGGTVTGSNGGTGLDFEKRNGTITSTGTSSIASAIRHRSTVTFDVQDGTLSLTGTVHNDDGGTKTIKTGAGTLTTSNWMNKMVEVQEGTLQITGGFGDGKRFNGEVIIAEGAQLLCASHDSLGHGSVNTKLHVYGLLDNTSGNETLNNTEIHMYGGTAQSSSKGTFDILNAEVKYYSHALEGATAEAPTVSTISAPTRLRTDGTFEIITDANSQLNLTGVISWNSGNANIVKLGEGTLVLSARSTYTNGITIREGKVIANAGNASASTFGTGLIVVEAGALLEFQQSNQLGYGANAPNDITIRGTLKPHTYTHIKNVTLEGGTIETEYAYDGGATGLDFGSRTGVITSTGESAIKSRIHINSGANATFNVTSGNLTLSGILKSDGGFTKTGDGTLTLSANGSTFTGNVTVNGGTLVAATGWKGANKPSVFGQNQAKTVTINEGAELVFAAQDVVSNASTSSPIQFIADGGTIRNSKAVYNNLNNTTFYDGAQLYAVDGNSSWKAYKLSGKTSVLRNTDDSAALPVTFAADMSKANATYSFGHGGSLYVEDITSASASETDTKSDLIISAILTNPHNESNRTFYKDGKGTVEFTGANTYNGTTSIREGVLRLSGNGTVGSSTVTIGDAGTLDLNVAEGVEKGFTGTVTGTGTVSKSGAGTLNLNDESGIEVPNLSVSAGRLNFQGTLPGNLTLESGAVFSPGNGVGSMTLDGDFTMDGGSRIVFELSGDTSDLLVLGSESELDISDDAVLELILTDADPDKAYTLIDTENGLGDYDTAFWMSILSVTDENWQLAVVGNTLQAMVASSDSVPEPATWILMVLGASGLYFIRRKNRK